MKDGKNGKNLFTLYRKYVLACCGCISMVVFLTFYNQGKNNEYKKERTKLDSLLLMQNSVMIEKEKEKVMKLHKINLQLEQQTDTLSSQLFALTTEIKALKSFLKTIAKK